MKVVLKTTFIQNNALKKYHEGKRSEQMALRGSAPGKR